MLHWLHYERFSAKNKLCNHKSSQFLPTSTWQPSTASFSSCGPKSVPCEIWALEARSTRTTSLACSSREMPAQLPSVWFASCDKHPEYVLNNCGRRRNGGGGGPTNRQVSPCMHAKVKASSASGCGQNPGSALQAYERKSHAGSKLRHVPG